MDLQPSAAGRLDVRSVLGRVDAYLHEVPRSGARAEDIGPFTLFVSRAPWPYYARPRPGAGRVTHDDVEVVLRRCDELGLPVAIEWVTAAAPSVADAARVAGLEVTEHPLLVLAGGRPAAPSRGDDASDDGLLVARVVSARADLAAARAVAQVGFGAPGTEIGPGGVPERDAALATITAETLAWAGERAAAGTTITVVAEDARGVVGSGMHQPVGDVSEVVGVAVLPVARRRGVGALVTSALVADARSRGVGLVLLSAYDDAVARVYERAGFTRVGSVGAASRPTGDR